MFKLYHNKEEMQLTIEEDDNHLWSNRVIHGIEYYNDCYYVANSRKVLQDFAKELKEGWIGEAKARLELLKEMTIKNKYLKKKVKKI